MRLPLPAVALGIAVPLYAAVFTMAGGLWVRNGHSATWLYVVLGLLALALIGLAAALLLVWRNPALRGARIAKPRYVVFVLLGVVVWLVVLLIWSPSPLDPAAAFAQLDVPIVIICCALAASTPRAGSRLRS